MDQKIKEILHQQLELLAERSKTCDVVYLPEITQAMCAIADRLPCESGKTITLRLGAKAFTSFVEDCAVKNARSGGPLDDYEVGPKLLSLANRNYSPEMRRMLVEWSSAALTIAKKSKEKAPQVQAEEQENVFDEWYQKAKKSILEDITNGNRTIPEKSSFIPL